MEDLEEVIRVLYGVHTQRERGESTNVVVVWAKSIVSSTTEKVSKLGRVEERFSVVRCLVLVVWWRENAQVSFSKDLLLLCSGVKKVIKSGRVRHMSSLFGIMVLDTKKHTCSWEREKERSLLRIFFWDSQHLRLFVPYNDNTYDDLTWEQIKVSSTEKKNWLESTANNAPEKILQFRALVC